MKKASLIDRLAWGTDAGFYRLVPQYVLHPKNEEEIVSLIKLAQEKRHSITWRAAGTSLSGQAISDSILAVVGKNWEKYSFKDNGKVVTLQPGIVGNRVNELLSSYGQKFAPDPASIKSAMVGGIVMNNASGMSCGVHANSDKMLLSVRIILADGTILDTGDETSKNNFRTTHKQFIDRIIEIRDQVRRNQKLYDRIRKKYSIKNVTGLNILPFVEYDDPFDIITHLMVGSEGTLAFMSECTMLTAPVASHSASALIYFNDATSACNAVIELKKLKPSAVELFDYKSLCSVKEDVEEFDQLPNTTIALLIKVEGDNSGINEQISNINILVNKFTPVRPFEFSTDKVECEKYWKIRSGIFPSVGSMRPIGTTCLIEDVAFPIEHLTNATLDLQALLEKYHYDDAVIYGHALEGNYHFIINQSFDSESEIKRYESLMEEVAKMVVDKYDGSLKAEHGTGRNMAPFVEKEWGTAAYEIMKAVKVLFDENNIFNPGVIFNDNPKCFIENIKPLPKLHPIVDKCIECGFCEVNCVSCGFGLSSRQRIVVQREISRLKQENSHSEELKTLLKDFRYKGNATCAGDGLCSTSCPIKINTGELIHVIREHEIENNALAMKLGELSATHLSKIESTLRVGLRLINGLHSTIGSPIMSTAAKALRYVSFNNIPLWTPAMPTGASRIDTNEYNSQNKNTKLRVVYFPSCINQTFGISKTRYKNRNKLQPTLNTDLKERIQWSTIPLVQKTVQLLEKAGYEVIFPEGMDNLCCGTIWESKGMPEIADRKTRELEASLLKASNNGEYPILCDQSPCVYRMVKNIKTLKSYEPVEFISKFLTDKLRFTKLDTTISIHSTCSTTKLGLKDDMIKLAELCATKVVVPEEIGCCGFAGDKGFTEPELNEWALRKLKSQLDKENVETGFSNSRTCEIGLTTNGDRPYMGIVYLVDKATSAL